MEMKVVMHRPASAANAVPVTICLSEVDQNLIRLLEKQGFSVPTPEVVEATSPEAVIEAMEKVISEDAPKTRKPRAKKASS